MTIAYKTGFIYIESDEGYTLQSADNGTHYDKEYFDGATGQDRVYPTTKTGIRISENNEEVCSALICEMGKTGTLINNSCLVEGNNLFICCGNKIYSLKLPDLALSWKKRLDPIACFGIYRFKDDLIVHGELSITRIDIYGNEKWNFVVQDVFFKQDGTLPLLIHSNCIDFTDRNGNTYRLDENGFELN